MSIVIQYDRKTGQILKVDDHPEWGERDINLEWYSKNPTQRINDAGWITPKPTDGWDGKMAEWLVIKDAIGNPQLVRKEEAAVKQEIDDAKERILLELVRPKVSKRCQVEIDEKLRSLPRRS